MSSRLIGQAEPASVSSTVATPSGVLQLKCACGGAPGPTGECGACRRERLARRRNAMNQSTLAEPLSSEAESSQLAGRSVGPDGRTASSPRLGQDFQGIRVHTVALTAQSRRVTSGPAYGAGQDGSGVLLGKSLYDPRCPMEGSCPDDPLIDYQGSGRTWCDTATGEMKTTLTEHCAGDCVAQHEAVHREDRAECCRGVKRCLDRAGSDAARRRECLDSFRKWYPKLSDWTECNAYSREVTCLTALISSGCDGGGGISAGCCRTLRSELAFATEQRDTRCATAKYEPCPFPALGDFPLPEPEGPRVA